MGSAATRNLAPPPILGHRNGCPVADLGLGEPLDPGPQASPGWPRVVVRSGRMVLPSALAFSWLAPVTRPQRAALAGAQSGAGSRRTAPAAPPPRPAGRQGSGRGVIAAAW